MGARGRLFNRRFARVSPVFVSLASALLCLAVISPLCAAGDKDTRGVKRQTAEAQFAKAEEQRALLNSKPMEKRTLADYKQVVTSYRRVYLITPHANEVPDAVLAVAELYTEMGDHFGRSYYQSAVDSYQFLTREYPKSKFCQDAYLRAAHLQKEQLGELAEAKKTYEDFLSKYRRSPRRREAEEGLAELALLQSSEAPAAPATAEAKSKAADEEEGKVSVAARPMPSTPEFAPQNGSVPRVRRITTSTEADSTRVTLFLEDTVQFTSGRIKNPERIFFDLHAARLTPEVARANIEVDGKLLTGVRMAQNKAGVVRVVLDISGVKDYTAALMSNPPRLVVDLYASAAAMRAAKAKRAKENADADEDAAIASTASPAAKKPAVQSIATKDRAMDPKKSQTDVANDGGAIGSSATPAPAGVGAKRDSANKNLRTKSLTASNGATSTSVKPDLGQPAAAAPPTHDGQATLTRALGLKIGRIVIDPGHGGHDTGTIGPTGFMEKDLCLDVALRLGKVIAQKLPGADVVYTRTDDTFIPLEERTHIANEVKADLFISIHANSSHNHDARGIETYYLNLKGTPEAMEVAARENASSQESVHDLEDLVKKIARNEKIDESREFAEDVQGSLSARIQKSSKSVRNRGVRKAPFVVLIGADMPSILTEISFLSNASDEKLLKKPEYRQRVADGLYQGMASYLQSLNSMTLNQPGAGKPRLPRGNGALAVEQSKNQQ